MRSRKTLGNPFRIEAGRRRFERWRRTGDHLFTFLDYQAIPFEDNFAERQIRPAVILRKNSQSNRSERGAVAQAVLMSECVSHAPTARPRPAANHRRGRAHLPAHRSTRPTTRFDHCKRVNSFARSSFGLLTKNWSGYHEGLRSGRCVHPPGGRAISGRLRPPTSVPACREDRRCFHGGLPGRQLLVRGSPAARPRPRA